MPCLQHPRRFPRPASLPSVGIAALSAAIFCVPRIAPAQQPAQNPADAPASIPAGIASAQHEPNLKPVSAKQAREADDAYLNGAKQVAHQDLEAAERSFAHAVELNPGDPDYIRALAVTRQQRVTELVQMAARAHLKGDNARSTDLLQQARQLDPGNPMVEQHFGLAAVNLPVDTSRLPAQDIASTLAGPIELNASSAVHSFHLRSSAQDLIRTVYETYGIKVTFDPSVTDTRTIHFDLDDVNFAAATRILAEMTHIFAVPLQPDSVLVARDTQENRDRLIPQVEETVYLPGISSDEMTELANVARTVFDVKQVTASATQGDILLRGDEPTLRLLNATYDDMLDGGSDVLLDVRIYEIDKTHEVNIGAQLPNSAGIFSIAAEANQLIAANQSLLQEAITSGVLKLNGTPLQNLITEVGFLIASGQVNASQYSNLLGIFGGGLTYAGLYLGSSSTFNLLLNSSDARTIDAVTLRAGNNKEATLRAGTRYPVVTATYSSGVSSSLASTISSLTASNPSLSALASQYLGSSASNIPQFQYEDLGITLVATPQIMHSGGVSLKIDLKLEALGGGTINSIPILNNRTLKSTVNVPAGQTAMLANLIDSNESKSLQGLPGLSELPGFQGTDQDTIKDSQELLITITPHIVRSGALHIASRRLDFPHSTPAPE
jgi:general secretion pathway protein D